VPGSDGDLSTGGAGSAKIATVTVLVASGTKHAVTNTAAVAAPDPAGSSVTLSGDDDTDAVVNVFTDGNPHESTPQNQPVTTPLADIVSVTGAPLNPASVTQDTAPAHGSLSIDPATGDVRRSGDSNDDANDVETPSRAPGDGVPEVSGNAEAVCC
jgi:hypothetical protein